MGKQKRSFPTGGSVAPDDLVGRESILRELFERTYRHGNSVVLSAPRQTGKTSVVTELLERVRRDGGWGVYVDCSAAVDDEADLARLIAAATYDSARGTAGAFVRLRDFIGGVPKPVFYQSDMDLAVSFHGRTPEPPQALLEKALALADDMAGDAGKRVVVVYDEFQILASISPTIFTRIRASLQHHMGHAAYVFAGSETGILEELFTNPDAMPFRLATIVPLPTPGADEWRSYIAARFAEMKLAASEDEIAGLIDVCGCHPRDLMEACEHLVTLRSLNPGGVGALPAAIARTEAGLAAQFEEIWKRLDHPVGTRSVAARIATGVPVYGRGRNTSTVMRAIDKLEREGLVRRVDHGHYAFTEPLFARFVLARAEKVSR
jgi:hypothetical protein